MFVAGCPLPLFAFFVTPVLSHACQSEAGSPCLISSLAYFHSAVTSGDVSKIGTPSLCMRMCTYVLCCRCWVHDTWSSLAGASPVRLWRLRSLGWSATTKISRQALVVSCVVIVLCPRLLLSCALGCFHPAVLCVFSFVLQHIIFFLAAEFHGYDKTSAKLRSIWTP